MNVFYRFPNVDLFSFLIGLLAGALAWLLIHQLFKLIPKILKSVKHNREVEWQEKAPEIDTWLRQQMLRKCESSHIASTLFPLSDVYVDLPLQIPLLALKSQVLNPDQKHGIYPLFPPVPQTPELQRGFAYPSASLSDLLVLNPHIVVLGEIGSGKTSLLARFASRILYQDDLTQHWNRHLPLYLHASELDFGTQSAESVFVQIARSIGRGKNQQYLEAVSRSLLAYYERSQLLLIVDGLDEFSAEIHTQAVDWIDTIHDRYPDLPIITTSGPFYSGKLEQSGFSGFFIAPFENHQGIQLIENWLDFVSKQQPDIAKKLMFHRTQLARLINDPTQYMNIFETTLRLWAYFFENPEDRSPFEAWISFLLRRSNVEVSFDSPALDLFQNITITPANLIKLPGEVLKESKKSGLILEILQSNLLIDLDTVSFRPIHPALIPFIQRISQSPEESIQIPFSISDPLTQFRFKLGLIRPNELINIVMPTSLVGKNVALFKYFESLVENSERKQGFLATAYQQILDSANSIASKIQCLAVMYSLPMPAFLKVLTNLQQSADLDTQLLAIFAHGIFEIPDRVKTLYKYLQSEKKEFREAALISMVRIWNPDTQKICLDHFMKTNEHEQKLLAELFAHKKPDGHEILKELSLVSDAKCRRAAIHGLLLVKEPWVKARFEEISVHDFEWNVRDAAVRALETGDEIDFVFLDPHAEAANMPWLLQFASRLGIGVPADAFPVSPLLQALHMGDRAEQIYALTMLARHPSPNSTSQIIEFAKKNRTIRIYAQEALQQISRAAQP